MNRSRLPVIADCTGCGVCCFHMGYPAFMRPRAPLTADQIDSDPTLRAQARNPATRQALLEGHPGEPHWHKLPNALRTSLENFLATYEPPKDGWEGPCIWLDMVSRKCRHHEYRPRVCRDFEIGSTVCREWRRHYRERIETVD